MRKSGVKQEIFGVWEANLDWSPKDIRTEVHKRLGIRRSKNNTYPGLRLVQSYIKDFKDNLGQLVGKDKPWSLGCLAGREIFPEALPVVMQVWRQKLTWFEPLTIRQAQWVAKLYRLIPADVVLLSHWADLYAIWERMGNLLGEKFESSAFDAALVMRPWELITAILTNTIKPDVCFGMLPIDELLRLSNETYVDSREEIDRVYFLWQYYLRKGPRWGNLNEKTQHEIEIQLRKWVLDCPWIEDERWLSNFMDGDISLTDLTASPFFKPSELLKEVGYEV